jgi:hypothetical protein
VNKHEDDERYDGKNDVGHDEALKKIAKGVTLWT